MLRDFYFLNFYFWVRLDPFGLSREDRGYKALVLITALLNV